jgi:tetratricopeptide (TPR) repeat protein
MSLRLGRFIVDFQNRFSCRGAAFEPSFIVDFQNRFLCRGAAVSSAVPKLVKSGRTISDIFLSAIFLSATLTLCSLASCAVSAQAQDADYQTAVSFVQQGQFDRAFPLLQRILDRSTNDLKARNLMGIALSAAGRREEANEQFKKVLALEPKFVPALKNLALNEMALGKAQDAKIHFEEALKSAPQDTACRWGLAEIAFAARDYKRAALNYEQSGDLAWKDSRTTIKFATSCLEDEQPAKAATILEKIPATLSGADANIQFQAGVMLARLEKYAAAAQRFELARQGSLDPYQAQYNLTLMLIRSRDYAAAIRAGEETLAAGHRKAEIYNLLAQAYEQSGQTKRAYDALRAATEIDPQDETNYLDLIALCLKHENYDLSLEIADIGARRVPSGRRLRLSRGVALVMKGRLEEAVKEFQTAGELSPEDALPQVALGLALIQLDKHSEAIALLRRRTELNPKDPRIFWLLGEALNRSGVQPGSEDEKEAINALEKSLQLDPRLPQSRALLGKMLLRRGEVARAAEQLEKAFELDPEDMTAAYQLAQALQRMGQTERAKQLFTKVNQAKSGELQDAQRNLMRIIKAGAQ